MSRLFANLFVIAFILTGALALTAFTLEGTLFAPETYQHTLERADLYKRLPAVLAQQLAENLSDTTNLVSTEDLQVIFITALPPADTQAFADEALIRIFAYINGKSSDSRISTLKLKDSLNANATEAFFALLSSKPACTAEQIQQLALNVLSGETVNALSCKPPAELLDILKPGIASFINLQVNNLPNTISFIPEGNSSFARALTRLRIFRTLLRFTPLLPLGCLTMITLLVVRSFKDFLKWWGAPFALTGFLTLIGAAVASLFSRVLVESFVTNTLSLSLPIGPGALIRDLLYEVSAQIWNPLIVNAALLSLVGAIMLIGTRFIRQGETQV